ncbi:Major facilitator superfamily domain-containing protein 5 [Auxenochlorella protothecoides]|uniref:Molybdate-anion transporter n=1 Tax=Auxenochlorella protothecoides TaxID=3075 RepID=A0A087SIY7_AUXPR|nr:Major facilitator superfamily domain-containing protein 5 [Auxenochlorella protothecoides]KFM25691.1 Major facilitator superfamily domain-containing protein 5 [Auxenochlorella protothecoides]
MEAFYVYLFMVGAVAAAVFEYGNRLVKVTAAPDLAFRGFKTNYLVVYSFMMAGDWLQGPYVYALYEHYGFTRGEIGRLFIAGFGSSMIFGTVMGSLADKYGRKRAALLYVVCYTLGCFTKHAPNFWVLFFGRILCGIATSLLYSAFESWVVGEHNKRGYNPEWLGGIFSQAVFLGNGLVAILAGLFSHSLVDTFRLGPVSPFDAAAIVLVIGGVIIALTWTENYGDSSESASLAESFGKAYTLIMSDPKFALLGAMQSLFEGSMYTFVFLWTPALSPNGEHLPHGMIFACFMVSSMVGSALAGKLMSLTTIKVERYMQVVFAFAALCLTIPVVVPPAKASNSDSLSLAGKLHLLAFCGFEVCVGIFWPSMMTMRSAHIPEEIRSTVINCFRIPLNFFVCVILYNVGSYSLSTMFGMCASFLGICFACQRQFAVLIHQEQAGSHFDEDQRLVAAAKLEKGSLAAEAEADAV